MGDAVLLSGGVGHDFAATSAMLAEILDDAGVTTEIVDEPTEAFARLAERGPELLVVNALRWRMLAERYAAQRDEWATLTPPVADAALATHLARGGGVLAVHTACICFDDWSGWSAALGGVWDWDRSLHPPAGAIDVIVHSDRHPIVSGVSDFRTVDEAYGFLQFTAPIEPLASSSHGGVMHPLLWARAYGGGRVVVDTLGHSVAAYDAPEHAEIVRRAARWLIGGDAP
jgi:type 1 glutamine amidotransferase